MSETGKILSQKNVSQLQRPGLADQDPALERKRGSSMLGQVSGHNDEVKINIHEQKFITTQKKTKWFESNRRYDRIVDIAKMLEKNGMLSKDERKWLIHLGKNDYQSYCKLGDMLRVRRLPRFGHHGVWKVEDRNKIRMQTMKAALHEAINAGSPPATLEEDVKTIDKALKAAELTRAAMTMDMGALKNLKAYNDYRAYEEVTMATLHNPPALYRKFNHKHAHAALYSIFQPPRGIHPDISQRDQEKAAKAVEILINNNLLDAKAALNLRNALRKDPKIVSTLLSTPALKKEPEVDHVKVRTAALLALAYNDGKTAEEMRNDLLTGDDNLDQTTPEYQRLTNLPRDFTNNEHTRPMVAQDYILMGDQGQSISMSEDAQEVKRDIDLGPPKYRRLPDLPSSGRVASKQALETWIKWATWKPKPGQASANESKTDVQDNKGGPNVKAGDNNNDAVDNERKEDIDDLPNLIVEEDPTLKKDSGKNSNDPLTDLHKKNADVPKNNAYKRIDQALSDDDLGELGDVGSSLEYDHVEYGGLKQDKFTHSQPVVLELRNNIDDNNLVDAMIALEAQEWSKTPLGASPLFPPGDTFTTASSKLSNCLDVFKLAAGSMLGPAKDDKMPLTVTPHIGGMIAGARANAMTARSELALLQKKLNASDVSQQKPDGGKRAAFEKDVAILTDQLNAIIRDTGLILYRANKAAPEQSGSPTYSEDNNNNNNTE